MKRIHAKFIEWVVVPIKSNTIEHETEKAILIQLVESENQTTFDGSPPIVKKAWVPKSIINKDFREIGAIHIPAWFYDEELR